MQWKGYGFEQYAKTASLVPAESIDLAMVDGRARLACISEVMPKIKPGGLFLDNSERYRYRPGIELLSEEGWHPIHFPGPGCYTLYFFFCSSLFQKPK